MQEARSLMTIYLDSADLDDARAAAELGFVRGITTNPNLMRPITSDPLAHTAELLADTDFPEIYYQPCGAYRSLTDEARSAVALAPERIVIKLPATPGGVGIAAKMIGCGARVALTAAQTPNAMIVAEALGAEAVIPYVDRALRDPRTDNNLVCSLASVRRRGTRIIAASVKNGGQFSQAFVDRADVVSAPLDVLRQVLDHPASLEAEQDFGEAYGAHSLVLATFEGV
jgi:transaldolase